ncbi:rhodanese-like domain-containing protein [Grimontia sp. NTOU-MAR1]|uniref:rhodanese-like domain-containing protein n=1 Tax=Grimontia sp. NTOU-MAR1 TaxID=3111011 RepID=UPI002DB9DE41|nr:rhodanese-like domain-containing protein [Grimontia sp. NTOU-MAR1]WRV96347.1 rhodanese-like domain-containing protein [Grimontia sp. NTOU-MAR1]
MNALKFIKEISFICAILCAFHITSISAETIPEPNSYRTENYRAAVPETLTGGQVIDSAEQLAAFIDARRPILIDVFPAPNKPKDLSPDTLWIEPSRETLPGAIWLANVGHGIAPDSLIQLLKTSLPNNTPMVVFCEPNCWHSWNAGKRAIELGAKDVYWYRAGVKGWKEAGYALETQHPVRP